MKKLFTLMAAALIMLTSACKKESSEAASENTFTLSGVTYKIGFTHQTELHASTPMTLFIFSDKQPTGPDPVLNSVNLTFVTPPTASGTYQLVSIGQAKTAKQFELSVGRLAEGFAYLGTSPTSSVDVEITVTGGKISVKIPSVSLKATGGKPDETLTANIHEI